MYFGSIFILFCVWALKSTTATLLSSTAWVLTFCGVGLAFWNPFGSRVIFLSPHSYLYILSRNIITRLWMRKFTRGWLGFVCRKNVSNTHPYPSYYQFWKDPDFLFGEWQFFKINSESTEQIFVAWTLFPHMKRSYLLREAFPKPTKQCAQACI